MSTVRSVWVALAVTACGTSAPAPSAFEIRDVSVVDVLAGSITPHRTVVIRGNRIAEITSTDSAAPRAGARVIDGRGKFLIPGLWDMHVHAFGAGFPSFFAPMTLAHGVTGVRDMGFFVDSAVYWKREVARGRVLGPRLIISGRVDDPANRTPFVAHARTAWEAGRVVDSLQRLGVDFIKVYSLLSRDAYGEIAWRSMSSGPSFAGHVPYEVSAAQAASSGQRSIEHQDDLMRACSSRDSVLRAELRLAALAPRSPARDSIEGATIRRHAAELKRSHDASSCARTIAELVRYGVRVTPTLVVYAPYAANFDTASTHPGLQKYISADLMRDWRRRADRTTAADTAVVTAYFSLERVRELHAAGVRLLAGTDAPLAYVYPGFSLHDELALFVRAGLTPMEALRTATIGPAAFLGIADSLGLVAAGKIADLVLLDADPLADIRNTRRISAVIANGRLLERSALDSLLLSVATANSR